MKSNEVHVPAGDVLEILFSNRNKDYGAYALRREYPDAMRKALVYSGLLFTGILGLTVFSSKQKPPEKSKVMDCLYEVDEKREIEKDKLPELPKPKTQAAPAAPGSVFKFVRPEIVSEDIPENEPIPATPTELPDGASIGANPSDGQPNGSSIFEEPASGNGSDPVEPAATEPAEEPAVYVEKMPSFPGGEAELLKFLRENIKYPALAKETSIQGRVVLSFVISKTGEISDIKIVRDIGGGCGKEAARVIGSMPKWNSGEQNGRPVKVLFTLPVLFKLEG